MKENVPLALLALVAGIVLAVAGGTLAGKTTASTIPSTGTIPFPLCDPSDLTAPSHNDKVSLCHATGSASNPFIFNEVSESAAAKHLFTEEHHGDCGLYGSATSKPNQLICVQ